MRKGESVSSGRSWRDSGAGARRVLAVAFVIALAVLVAAGCGSSKSKSSSSASGATSTGDTGSGGGAGENGVVAKCRTLIQSNRQELSFSQPGPAIKASELKGKT